MKAAETDLVGRMTRQISHVRDPSVRIALVRDALGGMAPGDIASVIQTALNQPGAAPATDDLLLLVLLALLDQREERAAIAHAAMRSGLAEVVLFVAPRDESVPETRPSRVPDFGTSRPLTLGERKSVARNRDRELVARVLRDPDPSVIAILLKNPAVTETDMVRLCALRPVNPEVLRTVLREPRWVVRYAVRRALVQNPHLPLDLAIPLAALLRRTDARAFAEAPDLRPALREACAHVARDVQPS